MPPSSSLDALPPELLDHVLHLTTRKHAFFNEHVRKQAHLAQLCLVSTTFARHVQPVLVHRVFLRGEREARLLERTLRDRPDLAALIQELQTRSTYHLAEQSRGSIAHCLPLLPLVPHLRAFTVTGWSRVSMLEAWALSALPHLESLVLDSLPDADPHVGLFFPALTSLSLSCVVDEREWKDASRTYLIPSIFPRLRALAFSGYPPPNVSVLGPLDVLQLEGKREELFEHDSPQLNVVTLVLHTSRIPTFFSVTPPRHWRFVFLPGKVQRKPSGPA
ncbi:hypothetical protein JCM10207_006400 [Rhodosporidiobolus poonsookiae]